MICDEESCNPLKKKNNNQQLPIDVAKNHSVFQHIQICTDRNKLRKELKELQKENRKNSHSQY